MEPREEPTPLGAILTAGINGLLWVAGLPRRLIRTVTRKQKSGDGPDS